MTGRAAVFVLLLCAGLLTGCAGSTLPFSKANDAPAHSPPAIVLSDLTGLTDDQASALSGALVNATSVRGINLAHGTAESGYVLAGEFEDTGAEVRYRWILTDERGRVLHRIAETEIARVSPETASEMVAIPVARIAAHTAESLSSRLSQLGYATRAAGMPPPLDHLVEAGPGAEQQIDYETLHGPGRSQAADAALDEDASSAVENDGGSGATESDGSIQGVAITGVRGAGSAGNGELAGALARVLTDAGWPVQERSRDNVLMIEGDVTLAKPDGEAQTVTLRWTVKAPDGQVLGAVEQANNIPANSLDDGWGEAADHAALAAAQGIFDLVDKLR